MHFDHIHPPPSLQLLQSLFIPASYQIILLREFSKYCINLEKEICLANRFWDEFPFLAINQIMIGQRQSDSKPLVLDLTPPKPRLHLKWPSQNGRSVKTCRVVAKSHSQASTISSEKKVRLF